MWFFMPDTQHCCRLRSSADNKKIVKIPWASRLLLLTSHLLMNTLSLVQQSNLLFQQSDLPFPLYPLISIRRPLTSVGWPLPTGFVTGTAIFVTKSRGLSCFDRPLTLTIWRFNSLEDRFTFSIRGWGLYHIRSRTPRTIFGFSHRHWTLTCNNRRSFSTTLRTIFFRLSIFFGITDDASVLRTNFIENTSG